MRNRYVRDVLCIMAVFCAAAVIGCGTKTVKDSDVVMEAAGQAVVKAEYQMILSGHVSEVERKYDTDTVNQESFWTDGQDGARPLDELMQLAEEDLREKKTVAQLAKSSGIEQKTDYLSIAAQLEEKHGGQQDAESPGNVSYGLTALGVREYYDYIYTQVKYELIEHLKKEQVISDEELKELYEENKEAYTSEVSVKALVGEALAETGEEQVLQAAGDMEEGKGLQYLAGKYPNVSFYEIEMSSLNMQEGKSGAYMQRWLTASQMQQGEVCRPFAIGQNIMVMRCLKRTEQSVQPFEEIKGELKSDVQSSLAYEALESHINGTEIALAVSEGQLEEIALEMLKD